MESERTPLRQGFSAPNYVFQTNHNPGRIYRTKVRQFQCCICAGLLGLFVLAVVITVSFSINDGIIDDNDNSTNTTDELQALISVSWPISDSPQKKWSEPSPSSTDVEAAIEEGLQGLQDREMQEAVQPTLSIDSPPYRHQKAVFTSYKAYQLSRSGYVLDLAARKLANGSKKAVGRGPKISADWLPQELCEENTGYASVCPTSPYRSVDGTCNNLKHPLNWGVAMRPFRRALAPDYADGVSMPRKAKDGGALPSAREVSFKVHRPLYRDDPQFTVMLAVWGQFLDHDITATALSQGVNGSAISCCNAANNPYMKMNPECFPVPLGPGDPYYHQYNTTCMEFVRSAPAPTCYIGPREQLNQASAYIDGSVVYGTSAEQVVSLRSMEFGRLQMTVTEDGRELLPVSTNPSDGCNQKEEISKGRYCFASGDSRANENLHLTSMHLLMARQHNLIAQQLLEQNPNWSDQTLFQETRRIIAAQMQHITYKEFLPILLGKELMDNLNLSILESGYYRGYNESVDASIANNFATAAFRFAHTLIPGLMKMLGNDTSSEEYVELHKMLFNPYGLYSQGYLDRTLKGALATTVMKVDPHVSEELSEHLFERTPSKPNFPPPCGLDLVSLNIQRGRDHGLPSYPSWRAHCGLTKPKTFEELKEIMDLDSVNRMMTLFKSVDDIDMYTGMLSETPVPGGILGPTVTCLVADQFLRLKQGDRYWYETSEQPQAFTADQLAEIRKTSLARIICDNSDSVWRAQPEVMRTVGDSNPRVNCSDLPRPDLRMWKQENGEFIQKGIGRIPISETALLKTSSKTKTMVSFGAKINGGWVSLNGNSIWNGKLPVNLQLPLFDSVSTVNLANDISLNKLSHGIEWNGTLKIDASGTGKLQGVFSFPQYNHVTGLKNFSVEWTPGEFSFDFNFLWNSTILSESLVFNKSYTSPLYLKQLKPMAQLQEQSLLMALNPPKSKLYEAPIILSGDYSPDRKSFLWSGNVTVILPTLPQATIINLSYWSDNNSPTPQLLLHTNALPIDNYAKKSVGYTSKQLILGAHVLAGFVRDSDGSTLWDGTTPFNLKLPLFDSVLNVGSPMGLISTPKIGHGILWQGTITADASGNAVIEGTYSLPKFIHGDGSQGYNFTVDWINGDFSLKLSLLWNSTSSSTIDLDGYYSSPVYLQSDALYSNTLKQMSKTAKTSGQGTPLSNAVSSEMPTTAPIILQGSFTADKMNFLWSGNITLVLTSIYPSVNERKSLASSNEDQEINKVTSTLPSFVSGLLTPRPRMSFGGRVTSGKLVTNDGKVIWNGKVPVTLTLPLFDSVASPSSVAKSSSSTPMFGHGIIWNGTFHADEVSRASAQGTFSYPQYIHGNGITNFSIDWISGSFSINIDLLWNSTKNSTIDFNGSFTSPLFLKKVKFNSTFQHSSYLSTLTSLKKFISISSSSDPVPQFAPLMLLGNFSPDNMNFTWNGNISFILPKSPQEAVESKTLTGDVKYNSYLNTQFLVSPKVSKVAVGIEVTSGSISASSQNAGKVTWWRGSLPAEIPNPPFDRIALSSFTSSLALPIVFGNGIYWTATFSESSPTEGSLSGTFSLPVYTRGGLVPSLDIEWWDGKFTFNIKSLWNTSLHGLIESGKPYSSPLFFKATKSTILTKAISDKYMSRSLHVGGITDFDQFLIASQEALLNSERIPIVLEGSYSPDRTAFWWSGNATLIIPTTVTPPPMPVESSIQKSRILIKKEVLVPEKVPFVQAGATVSSGYITMNSKTLWNGDIPAVIPMLLFDSTVQSVLAAPPIFGHGVMWQGRMTSNTPLTASIMGSFQLPQYIHNGFNSSIKWLQGEFSLNLNFLWNVSTDGMIIPETTYTSPIYFQGISPKKSSTKSKSYITYDDESAIQFAILSQELTDSSSKIPIILQGTFSPDRTLFYWNGNAILSFQKQTISEYSPKPITFNEIMGITPIKSTVTRSIIGGNVSSGYITGNGKSLWDGSLPFSIKLPLFDHKIVAVKTQPLVYGNGVTWQGTLKMDSVGYLTFQGSFSAPTFTHGTGLSNFSLDWTEGEFLFTVSPAWNTTSLDLLTLDSTYSSPVYFTESRNISKTLLSRITSLEKSNNLQFASETLEAMGEAQRAPIILVGTFSPDHTSFLWSGKFIINLPSHPTGPVTLAVKMKPSINKPDTIKGKPTKKPGAIGITVVTGNLTAAISFNETIQVDNSTESFINYTTINIWSGKPPAAIPVSLFNTTSPNSTAVIWNGTFSATTTGGTMSAKFSLPGPSEIILPNNEIYNWTAGELSLDFTLMWPTTTTGIITPGTTYSSPIIFRSTVPKGQTTAFVSDLSTPDNDTATLPQMPIILQGSYVPGETSFLWSGNAIIILPK